MSGGSPSPRKSDAGAPPSSSSAVPASQLLSYHALVDEHLRPLLERRRTEAVSLRAAAAEFDAARAGLEGLAFGVPDGEPHPILADLGAGFRVRAEVEGASSCSAAVDVGCGVFVEMHVREAAAFAGLRAEALRREARLAEDEAFRVAADLGVAVAGLDGLLDGFEARLGGAGGRGASSARGGPALERGGPRG
jgi:prefoldin subunit 5